jgi:hypothetical protein
MADQMSGSAMAMPQDPKAAFKAGRVGIAGDCSAPVGPAKCGSRVTWHYLSQQDRLSIIIFNYLSLVLILSVNVEINSFNSNL